MSRAFTKEIDDVPAPKLPELPVSSATNLVTPRGAELIVATTAAIAKQLATAKGPAALDALRRDQRYWEARRASMQIVDAAPSAHAAGFGTAVSIRRRGRISTVRIVGEDEADPPAGLIAWTSPLAKALADAKVSDTIEFEVGGRSEKIDILSIGS